MDPQTFASERGERLETADEELEPFVRAMLTRWGDDDFDADLLEAAGVLWLEVYQDEAPSSDPAKNLRAYQEALHTSLLETAEPEAVPEEAQVDRITKWVSTFTANDAVWRGTAVRGGRFTRWNSMRDAAVRTTHAEADGQIRPVGGTFDVGGYDLHYPGEPVGPPEIWINCRCLIQSAARTGEAMSGTTYTIPPEDSIDDNPDIIPGSDVFAVQEVDADVASGAVVEWTDENGTRYYGPFDTAENAQRWIESDSAPFDGESRVIETVDVPKAADVQEPLPDTEPIPIDEDGLIPDEPEEDEELITEIPVHGVLAPEGVPTGDGRMFALESLSTRDLPVPLLYEYVHSHGGNTSMSSTVGRVDTAWRDEATNMWRWTGAIVLSTTYAQEAIDGMVNGLVRGVSIDGDAAELEVREISGDEMDGDDLLEMLIGGGEEVYAKMRVAGLTIVPIPAFQEAYIALGHEFQEDLTDAEVDEQLVALQACGCMSPESDEDFRDVSTDERKRLADKGAAMPDGSYPIANCDDLANAIQAIGRAKDPEATKAHIRKRKAALGCDEVELPTDWSVSVGEVMAYRAGTEVTITEQNVEAVALAFNLPVDTVRGWVGQSQVLKGATFAPGTHDGPGWITHPVPTARIRRYWTQGEGAAKIKWGAPGDFNRCRTQLAKYVQNPDWLAGLCANMHYEALKIWPAQHHGSRVIVASAAVAERSPIARLVEPEAPVYPSEWFSNPGLDRPVPLRIDRETRRVYGYAAEWGVCHVGMAGLCQEVPQSHSNYGYYLKGLIDTDKGEQPVGVLSFGGHASRNASMARASDYYDKPDAVRAYVNVGEDAFGIWFAGIIPPEVTDEDITKMRAIGAVSGDWREVRGQLELIGVPIVNTPGFPVLALTASAGRQISLIGAGALKPEPELVMASASSGMDAELVAGIVRTTVAEYRHQEQLASRAEPQRAKVRQRRLEAARSHANRE